MYVPCTITYSAGSGWAAPNSSFSYLVAGDLIVWVKADANTDGDHCRASQLSITYTVPDVDKSL